MKIIEELQSHVTQLSLGSSVTEISELSHHWESKSTNMMASLSSSPYGIPFSGVATSLYTPLFSRIS